MNTQEIKQLINDTIKHQENDKIDAQELNGVLQEMVDNDDIALKIQNPTGGMVLISDLTGSYIESDKTIDDLLNGNGNQGVTGVQGVTGIQGLQGVTGSKGLKGDAGAIGSTGLQGVTGVGFNGSQGVTGLQGVTGANGILGAQGVTGIPGSAGVRGPQGYQGVTGEKGPAGPHGGVGATGVQGVTGSIVSYTQNYGGTGTNIGVITINGVSTTIYIPSLSALEERIQALETRIAEL